MFCRQDLIKAGSGAITMPVAKNPLLDMLNGKEKHNTIADWNKLCKFTFGGNIFPGMQHQLVMRTLDKVKAAASHLPPIFPGDAERYGDRIQQMDDIKLGQYFQFLTDVSRKIVNESSGKESFDKPSCVMGMGLSLGSTHAELHPQDREAMGRRLLTALLVPSATNQVGPTCRLPRMAVVCATLPSSTKPDSVPTRTAPNVAPGRTPP